MGVRIAIEIRRANRPAVVRTAALLNSGFESETPEILVPSALAARLGFLPELPAEAQTEEYLTVGGKAMLYRIPDAVSVRVVEEETERPAVRCSVVISSAETEAILSDASMSDLGVEIIDAKRRRWRFAGETGTRDGAAPQQW